MHLMIVGSRNEMLKRGYEIELHAIRRERYREREGEEGKRRREGTIQGQQEK